MANKSTNAKPAAAAVKTATTPAAAKPVSAPATVVPATELKGTPAALIAAGVTFNGKLIDAAAIANLRKYHYGTAIRVAGYDNKPQGQKGKAVEKVELVSSELFKFELPNAVAANA